MVSCTNAWHKRDDFCPSCGQTDDGTITLNNAPLALFEERTVVCKHRQNGSEQEFTFDQAVGMSIAVRHMWIIIRIE